MFPGFTIVLFTVLAFGTTAAAQAKSSDVQAIHALVDRMTEAFNAHDARAATAMYADDADFVSVRGERAHGRSEIERRLAQIFATRAGTAILRTLNMSIRFPRADVAIVHVTNELSGWIAPDGLRLPPSRHSTTRLSRPLYQLSTDASLSSMSGMGPDSDLNSPLNQRPPVGRGRPA